MRFLRGVWRFLVGVKDALALVLLLVVFLGIFAATRGGAAPGVPSGAALVLDLDGVIVDQVTEPSFTQLLAGGADIVPEIAARDIVEAIQRAHHDKRIESIVLQLDSFYGAGQANLQTIATELKAFRASGKPIYAYGAAYLDDGYYLAAQASEAWINPLGGVLIAGPGGSNLYFRGALEKLGVDVEVFRVGTYKAAVEPFTRTESSPEAKAANQALVDALWATYVADVQAARPRVRLDTLLANLPARVRAADGDFARQAVADGLVDRIGTGVDFGRAMAKRAGPGDDKRPGSYHHIKHRDYLAASTTYRNTTGPAVGVVYVSGEIIDGEAPRGMAGADTISELIAEAATDTSIKALVVRVDSPGGSVTASEKIRQALAEAKADGLPIVASFGPVAASGGYWVSTAADEVFAEPSTITGSIGVFALIPTFEATLSKLGITADGVRSTPYSGEPDLFQGLSPHTQALLQASVEDIYRRFIGLVAKARGMAPARVDAVGQGRVWAGGAAHQLGLVTRLGSLDDAIAAAAKRAGLDDARVRVVDVERKPPFPAALLASFMAPRDQQPPSGDVLSRIARLSQIRAAASVADAARMVQVSGLQARCLACGAWSTPRLSGGGRTSLVALTARAATR